MTRLALAALLLLTGCQPVERTPAATVTTASAGPAKDCPIIGSSDWAAWINAMPGPPGSRPTLIVTGTVTVPSGGYRLTLRLDPAVMESLPPQRTVWLDAVPPDGPASQALVTSEVRGQWPASPPVGAVHVRCGGAAIARIGDVVIAQ